MTPRKPKIAIHPKALASDIILVVGGGSIVFGVFQIDAASAWIVGGTMALLYGILLGEALMLIKSLFRARPVDLVPQAVTGAGTFFGLGGGPDAAKLLEETQGVPATATRAIANRLSGLNPQVLVQRRSGQSGTVVEEVLDDHPMKDLLDHPHPQFTRLQMLRLITQWIVATGDAYLLKVRNGMQTPRELHPIPPTMVQPIVGEANVLRGYQITDANGVQRFEPASEMIRIWYPDPLSPWTGQGYLRQAGLTADAHKFEMQHLRTHFEKDATPKTALEAMPEAKPFTDEAMKKRWGKLWLQHYGQRVGEYVGIPAITPPGYKLVQLAMQSGEGLVPILEYLRDDMLMSYMVPRSVLGQVVSGDRSSAEVNQWVMDMYAVEPITKLISDAFTTQLAIDFQAPDMRMRNYTLFCKFEDFVSDDKEFTLKREGQDLDKKVTTINEIREDRGDDPVEWGDEPIGTPQDVPYDPESAAERINRPPVAKPAFGQPAPADEPKPEEEPRALRRKLRRKLEAIQ